MITFRGFIPYPCRISHSSSFNPTLQLSLHVRPQPFSMLDPLYPFNPVVTPRPITSASAGRRSGCRRWARARSHRSDPSGKEPKPARCDRLNIKIMQNRARYAEVSSISGCRSKRLGSGCFSSDAHHIPTKCTSSRPSGLGIRWLYTLWYSIIDYEYRLDAGLRGSSRCRADTWPSCLYRVVPSRRLNDR